MWEGWFTDWDLATEVAKIPDDVWEQGVGAVAERIETIKAERIAKALPQAEELSLSANSGLFEVEAVTTDPDRMIDRIFKQIDFSLKLALRGHNVSGFGDLCTAYEYLDHTRLNCRDDPNAVHMHLRLAREIIQSRMDTGEYQVEDGLVALASALERHEIQLRADHPVVREAHTTFVAQRLRELDQEKKIEIAANFLLLSEDCSGRLKTEFTLDSNVLHQDLGEAPQAEAIKRSGGRSQEINLIAKGSETIKAADNSGLNKGVGLMFRLQRLAELIYPLL